MPAKGGAARPPEPESPEGSGAPAEEPRYRIPDPETVAWAARRLLARGGRTYPSQRAFRDALLERLRDRDPLFSIGNRRLRSLLVGKSGLRVSVRYAERPRDRPLTNCPVCGSELRPIRNRTLQGESVTLGFRCPRCSYWTHRTRRVPVRYFVSPAKTAPG